MATSSDAALTNEPRQTSLRQPGTLLERFRAVRTATAALTAPLSDEDCAVQSMPDASPAKWHLAHTSWFFETFILKARIDGYRVFHPSYEYLFNSYYNAVGPMHPRPQRGLLTRPSREEILAYRAHVDREMEKLLGACSGSGGPSDEAEAGEVDRFDDVEELTTLGLHHEQQHQELLLTDIKHALSLNPLNPIYLHERGTSEVSESAANTASQPRASWGHANSGGWRSYKAGLYEIGAAPDRGEFIFDNESPRHRVYLEAFALAQRPVTAGEFARFIEAGGYQRPELWLSDGWASVVERGWRHPIYWRRADGTDQTHRPGETDAASRVWENWCEFTLGGVMPIDEAAPVCHLSFYEADAYATWAGARLPTEAEWEVAASRVDAHGNFVESGALHPRVPSMNNNAAADPPERTLPSQMFGDVWEWTASPYVGYPGYSAREGALGEYNGKFMSGQMVLRGGSCVTPASHIRRTYRNFFPPHARWQFSGLRLARDKAED